MGIFKKIKKADTPQTVQQLTREEIYRRKLQSYLTAKAKNEEVDVSDGAYIWRKADEYTKQYLPGNGYYITESSVFDNCIGYRCIRNNDAYTVLMFAYDGDKPDFIDAAFCKRQEEVLFAQESIVLILCLKVLKYTKDEKTAYKVLTYNGNENFSPELWALEEINGKTEFLYYPRKEVFEQTLWFMYAFNRENTDVYDCIIAENNPSIEGEPGCDGILMNSAFYLSLRRMHQRFGNMKLRYFTYGTVYSKVPYIDNVGFFHWSFYLDSNRMHSIKVQSFHAKGLKFINSEMCEPEDLLSNIPQLIEAVAFPPVPEERFAVKLLFDNGQCRKYILPIENEFIADEAVQYKNHVFSDGIWASVKIVPAVESRERDYPSCGPAITFKNGFYISQLQCYLESQPYSRPELTDETVFSDDRYDVRKIWEWDIKSAYEDNETGLLKVLLYGDTFTEGKSVFATVDGRRLTSINFDDINDFKNGIARAWLDGKGYGYVDKNLDFITPVKYSYAKDFMNDNAIAMCDGRWYVLDKSGNETLAGGYAYADTYQETGYFSEGLCKVSTFRLRSMDLAYFSDYRDEAGIWGYINESGEQIIAPQYIYANNFENGVAIVTKGKWTKDPKWNNKCNHDRYWTEYELWGGIDKNGNEVIPFIFDEIKHFFDRNDIYMAHYGGWNEGKWGVIDNKGNWLAPPIFEMIDYCSNNNLIAYYNKDYWEVDDALCGIYDLNEKKIVLEPRFKDIDFLDNGDLCVEVYDKELGGDIEKIIDLTGKERFKSIYTSISTWEQPYRVMVRENDEIRHGIIDSRGEYHIALYI